MFIISIISSLLSFLFQNIEAFDALRTENKNKPQEFRNLLPLPCVGNFEIEDGYRIDSCFLGPEKMSVSERSDGKMICSGLVPIQISGDIEPALFAAMKINDRSTYFKSWSGATITDRDAGLFDAVSPLFAWNGRPNARKEIYEALRLRGNSPSPYHGILAALEKYADLVITGLLIEVADRPSRFSLALGATLLVAKKSHADKWTLTSSRYKILKEAEKSEEVQLVKCFTDELLGIAYVTGLPVVMPSSVYETISVNGLLERKETTGSMMMNTPHFSTVEDKKLWYTTRQQQRKQQQQEQARAAKKVPKAADIKDASAFLLMKTSEKRACLRASGVIQLPRPREGPRAVDALMIPLLDEEVAYEVMRRLAETKGDFAAAAEMEDFQSRKPQLARQYREAKRAGDNELAKQLCDELNSLSTLKFDPTNPNGVIEGAGWDVEEWYWEARKRVYGIIAA